MRQRQRGRGRQEWYEYVLYYSAMAERVVKAKKEVLVVTKAAGRVDARSSAIEAALRLGFNCQHGCVGLPKVVLYGFLKQVFELNTDGPVSVKSDQDGKAFHNFITNSVRQTSPVEAKKNGARLFAWISPAPVITTFSSLQEVHIFLDQDLSE